MVEVDHSNVMAHFVHDFFFSHCEFRSSILGSYTKDIAEFVDTISGDAKRVLKHPNESNDSTKESS